MNKNDIAELEITDYSSDGNGVARYGGAVVFVPFSAVGDKLEVLIIKAGKSYCVGKILRIITPSPDRITPLCSYAGKCGGCSFQHISYEAECRAKLKFVNDALSRIGKLSVRADRILPSDTRRAYRNKACFPVSEENGELVSGFYALRSHRIASKGDCFIQSDIANRVKSLSLDFFSSHGIVPYNEHTGTGLVRHIFVRNGQTLCVMLVLTSDKLPFAEEYIELLKNSIAMPLSILINVNSKNTNKIMGDKFITLYGSGVMSDRLCGLDFDIAPASFYQVNHDQCERLYNTALDMAEITSEDTVLDLFCGIGTITLLEAQRAKRVIGVEIVQEAIDDAVSCARKNKISNVEFMCADASKAAEALQRDGTKIDVMTVDPPRAGLDTALIDEICKISPKRLVYISCNPSTLSRDAALLSSKGYTPQRAVCADMFPATRHVETVMLMSRVKE